MTVVSCSHHSFGSTRPEELGKSFDAIFSSISSKNLDIADALIDTRSELHLQTGEYLVRAGFDVHRIVRPVDFCASNPAKIWECHADWAAKSVVKGPKAGEVGKTSIVIEVMYAFNLAFNWFEGTESILYMKAVAEAA